MNLNRGILFFVGGVVLFSGCATIQPVRSSGGAGEQDARGEKSAVGVEAADLSARMDILEKKLQELAGKLEALEHGSDAASYRRAAGVPLISGQRGPGPSDILSEPLVQMKVLFDQQRFEEAASLLEKLNQEEKNPLYLFYLAEAHFQMEAYVQAILDYEQLKTAYPKFEKLPSAYLRQSEAFLKLGKHSDAILFYEQLIEDYPQSEEAKVAKSKLTTLKN